MGRRAIELPLRRLCINLHHVILHLHLQTISVSLTVLDHVDSRRTHYTQRPAQVRKARRFIANYADVDGTARAQSALWGIGCKNTYSSSESNSVSTFVPDVDRSTHSVLFALRQFPILRIGVEICWPGSRSRSGP